MNSLTVLLVEDDELDVLAARRLLEREEGLDLVVVHHADAASEVLRTPRGRRAVVLDLNLPGRSGHELLAELRGDPALQGEVVFVLSTSVASYDVELAYEQNVAGYFSKQDDGLRQLLPVLRSYRDGCLLPS